MRDSYVPLFQDTLTSSVWALADLEVRIAWFFFLLAADEDGFVSGTAPGLAAQAHISVEGMRRAIAVFEAPDPDSRTPDHDGRRLERVPRGWRVINLVAARDRARRESERARKRRWAQEHRARGDYGTPEAATDHTETAKDPASSGSMEEPAGQSMHPPEVSAGRREEAPSNEPPKQEAMAPCDLADREGPSTDAVSTPRSAPVDARKRTRTRTPSLPPPSNFKSKEEEEEEGPRFYELGDDFVPSAELVAYAERFGLPPMALHERLRKVRNAKVPIGGKRGVGDREQWCRDQLPRWKKWWLDDGGRAEPLPVQRRPPQKLPEPGTGTPMPEALLKFVQTGQLPKASEVAA